MGSLKLAEVDGALFSLSEGSGSFLTVTEGLAIVIMNGLISGEAETVRRCVDSVFGPLLKRGLGVRVLVRTLYPSFSLPTPSVRYGLLHMRKYLNSVDFIYFLDLKPRFSPFFWIACKALPSEITNKIRLSSTEDVGREMGIDFSSIVPSSGSTCFKEDCAEDDVLSFSASKYGGGRWKGKQFGLTKSGESYEIRWEDEKNPSLKSDAFVVTTFRQKGETEIEFGVRGRHPIIARCDPSVCRVVTSLFSERPSS